MERDSTHGNSVNLTGFTYVVVALSRQLQSLMLYIQRQVAKQSLEPSALLVFREHHVPHSAVEAFISTKSILSILMISPTVPM